jgi:hypothetical protein
MTAAPRRLWDKTSGNTGFGYLDDRGQQRRHPAERHQVWMLDAAAELEPDADALAPRRRLGRAVAAGLEDPGFWDVLKAWRSGRGISRRISARIKETNNVDVEGNGEILRIDATPEEGARQHPLSARSFRPAPR